jgi:fluoroacetyl-CoA thioesterase
VEHDQQTAELAPDLSGEVVREVTDEITADAMGSGGVRVLGTPAMIMLMEQAALKAVEPYLAEGQTTVGTRLDVRHLAATPVGMRVTVRARLVEVDGRRLTFEVEAEDEREPVGKGRHERFIIDRARFLDRVQNKAADR